MNSDARSFEEDLSLLKADVAVIRSNYVTKADLQEVRTEMSLLKADVAVIRSNHVTKADLQEVRTEIADLRAELHKAINGQTWRLIGFASALVLASHFAARAGY
jgi:ABC-type metal ion transport system substrate-binding protein